MNRIALIGVLLVAAFGAALAVVWNISSDRPAASVNGADIAEDDFVAVLESVVGNEVFIARIDPGLNEGRAAGTYEAAMAASLLTSAIYDQVLDSEATDREVTVDDDDRARALDELTLQYGGGQATAPLLQQEADRAAGAPILDGFGEDQKADLIEARAVQIALRDDLIDPAELEAALAGGAFTCASHILVDTEEQALDVLAQLEGGADFAQLAQAVSTDPGSPAGDLGCQPGGTFVPEFEQAILSGAPGQLVGPTETQFGFHVIAVRDAEPVIVSDLGWRARNEVLTEAFGAASIEVDSRWGTWNPETFRVEPPVAPEPEPFDFDA